MTIGPFGLARIIHEGFYGNRRHVAPTGLTAGGLATRSVNILCKYASLPRGSACPSFDMAQDGEPVEPSRVASRRFRHEPS